MKKTMAVLAAAAALTMSVYASPQTEFTKGQWEINAGMWNTKTKTRTYKDNSAWNFNGGVTYGLTDKAAAQFQYYGLMQLFTFIYSKRTGTKAAEMPDPTPRKEKTDRMTRLLATQDEIAMALVKAQVGQTVRVLVEGYGRNEGTLSGRLDNNLTVEFAADPALLGSYATVHLTGARATVLLGEVEA